jgi:hypothetical protein
VLPTQDITRAIFVLRGHRVLLDSRLAALYEVTTNNIVSGTKIN